MIALRVSQRFLRELLFFRLFPPPKLKQSIIKQKKPAKLTPSTKIKVIFMFVILIDLFGRLLTSKIFEKLRKSKKLICSKLFGKKTGIF